MAFNPSAPFSTSPKPPSLHWALVLLFTVVTFGLFGFIWMIIQARFVRQIDPANRSLFQILVGAALFLFSILMSAIVALTIARGGQGTDLGSIMSLMRFFQILMVITAYLQIRKSLTQHYGIKLNALLTVFFNVYYIQYHLSKLAKTSGITVSSTAPSSQAGSVSA